TRRRRNNGDRVSSKEDHFVTVRPRAVISRRGSEQRFTEERTRLKRIEDDDDDDGTLCHC
ncbi:hypothetical protein S245_008334, partial [Arachis hypogaea]